jgi:transcriptional regulator with GAF, ATPase, and Fis domain
LDGTVVQPEAALTTDEFQRFCTVAGLLIPHDRAVLTLRSPDKLDLRLFSRAAAANPNAEEDLSGPAEGDTGRLMTDEEARRRGFGTGVRVPIRVTNETGGSLTFLAEQSRAYDDDTLQNARALADYVSTVLGRHHAVRHMSEELLSLLAGVLDIRDVFPRLSEIVATALPHDRLVLRLSQDQVTYVTSNDDGPSIAQPKGPEADQITASEFKLIGDLSREPLAIIEPADLRAQLLAAGYRSFLIVRTSTRFQPLSLSLWSKQPHAFSLEDVTVARHVAGCVGLAFSHQQLAEAAQQVAEADARAERLEVRAKSLAAELDLRSGFGRAVGHSPEWTSVLKKATQVAATETTALVQGESGTGKEVVARFIHRASPRKDGPFVAINCAALPEQLLESELFGYERGAFTGAQQSKIGQIELAANGVLFLDEITEMSLSAQAKLLRVLQEREFQRLGGTRPIKANMRVIAATNRDLRKAVERGTFREDLYYRLQVFEIVIPPLRDRKSDVLALADAFLQDITRSFGRPVAGLTVSAKRALLDYSWPGNVRELRNALERAAIVCEGGLIAPQHLSLPTERQAITAETTDLNVVERQTIEQVMRATRGNKSNAAKRLGLTRTQLYGRLRKYGLDNTHIGR